MKKKFLKYFIICTAIILFMSKSSFASSFDIPVWATNTTKLNVVGNNIINNITNQNNIATHQTTNSITSTVNSNSVASPTLKSQETVTNNPLNLTCGSAILIEQNTGNVLYDYNMHEKLRPASVTKVMTILLIMEALDSGKISLTDKIPCSKEAAGMGGSQIWLETTEELTVDEMLKAICVVSANDCTVAMAEYLEGSEEAFVAKMNERAKQLGMNDTTFKNCHGIDEDGHLTSAYDIAIMSRELLVNHPSITKYTTIYMDSLRDGKSELVNTNKLVRNYDGCTGLKTGSTSLALFNLSASATKNGLSLIAVILKGSSSEIRFTEARKLLDYGFSNYEYKNLGLKGDIVGTVNIHKGIENSTNAILKNDIGIVIKKTKSSNVSQNVELFNNISAPISTGQKVGEVSFYLDNKEVCRADLVSSSDISKYSFAAMATKVYKNWFSLLRT